MDAGSVDGDVVRAGRRFASGPVLARVSSQKAVGRKRDHNPNELDLLRSEIAIEMREVC